MLKLAKSIIVLTLLALPVPAAAQAASVDDKLKYILEISDAGKVMDAAFNGFRPMVINQLRQVSNKITPEIAEHITNIMAEELNGLKPEFMSFTIDLYKKEWSEEEISAWYDFYKTPIGSRVGRKMAKFTENMLPQVEAFMKLHFLPKFQARLARDETLRRVLTP